MKKTEYLQIVSDFIRSTAIISFLVILCLDFVNAAYVDCSGMGYQPSQYWNFEEGSGNIAISAGTDAKNGTIVNAKYTTFAKVGSYATRWSNSGYINLSYFKSMNTTSGGFTIIAWVYLNTTQSNLDQDFIFCHENGATLRAYPTTQNFRTETKVGTVRSDVAPNNELPINEWRMIGVKYDGTTIRHIINGKIYTNASDSDGWTNTNTEGSWIGSYTNGGSNNMEGYIDDIALYPIALPDNYILDLYNNSNGMPFCYTNTSLPASASVVISSNLTSNGNFTDNPLIIYFNGTTTNTPNTNLACSLLSNLTGENKYYFGNGYQNNASLTNGNNQKYASLFKATATGLLTNISSYVGSSFSSADITVFVYSKNSSGLPGDLLAFTNKSITSSGVFTFDIPPTSAPYVYNGTDYFIGWHLLSNNNIIYYRNTSPSTSIIQAIDAFSDGLNNSWDGAANSSLLGILNFNMTVIPNIKTNLNISQKQNFTIDTTEIEKGYYFTITCLNTNSTDSVTKTNVFIDTVNPSITLYSPGNNTYFYKNLTALNVSFNVTATDYNLYAFNVSLIMSNGSIIFNYFNTSISAGIPKRANYEAAISLNSIPPQKLTLRVTAWDSHTAREIPVYTTTDITNGKNIAGVKITSDAIDTFKTTKKKDRYTFDMKFKQDNPIVYVECLDPVIVKDSLYKGHIVCLQEGKWIDFEEYSTTPTLIKEGKRIKVTLKNVKSGDLKHFESIGDLNILTKDYFIYLNESVYIYAYDFNTNLIIPTFSAWIYNDSISARYNTTSGLIVSNLTGLSYIVNLTSADFIPGVYTLNFTPGTIYNLSINASAAFTVYIRDQLTRALIQPQTVYLEFIGDNSSNYSTTTGYKYISNLLPDDYIIRYAADNYTSEFYYYSLVNGTNSQFTIFMLPQTAQGNSNITASVVDGLQDPVSDAYIYVQRYDLNTNTYLTVSISKTNFEGKTILHLTKNTEFYKFLIYYDGALKLTVDPTYIFEDTINFQINLNEEIAGSYFTAEGVDYTLDFNTATLNFRYLFLDPDSVISSGTLKVYNVSSGFQDLVTSTTVNGVSGTILINAANVSGKTYRADAYVNIDGTEYYLSSLYYNYPYSAPLTRDRSMLFYLTLLTLLFVGLAFFDLRLAVVLAPLPWLFASMVNWIPLPIYIIAPLEIMALIIAFIISR